MADEAPGQVPEMAGEGNQPEGTGYAPPDPGEGEAADSEIPRGVDALTDEQIQAAQEHGGGDDDGDSDNAPLDVSAAMADSNDEPEGEAAAEAQAETEEAQEQAEA